MRLDLKTREHVRRELSLVLIVYTSTLALGFTQVRHMIACSKLCPLVKEANDEKIVSSFWAEKNENVHPLGGCNKSTCPHISSHTIIQLILWPDL